MTYKIQREQATRRMLESMPRVIDQIRDAQHEVSRPFFGAALGCLAPTMVPQGAGRPAHDREVN